MLVVTIRIPPNLLSPQTWHKEQLRMPLPTHTQAAPGHGQGTSQIWDPDVVKPRILCYATMGSLPLGTRFKVCSSCVCLGPRYPAPSCDTRLVPREASPIGGTREGLVMHSSHYEATAVGNANVEQQRRWGALTVNQAGGSLLNRAGICCQPGLHSGHLPL